MDGSTTEFAFVITPLVSPITGSSFIYLKFPYYYTPSLSNSGIFSCTINGDPVFCESTEDRVLTLKKFIKEYDANEGHPIRIYGIGGVIQPVSPGKIFVAIDHDDDPSEVVEQAEIADPTQTQTTAASVGALEVNNITTATNEFRVLTRYNITFTSPTGGIAAGDMIVLDFPEQYTTFLQIPIYAPKCQIIEDDISGTTIYASACTVNGLRVKIPIETALTAETSFRIEVKNVRNPDDASPKTNKIIVSVVTSDESTVLFRSNSPNVNANWISFKEYRDIRVNASYQTTFTAPATDVPAAATLKLTFSDEYEFYFTNTTLNPGCNLKQTDASVLTIYSATCTITDLAVTITLSEPLPADKKFVIAVYNINHPDTIYCECPKPSLTLSGGNVPVDVHSNWAVVKDVTPKQVLQWSTDPLDHIITLPIQLINGLFSEEICLQPRTLKFAENVQFKINEASSALFTTSSPNWILAEIGARSTCFKMSPSQDTPPTFYELNFDMLEETYPLKNYTNVPRLRVEVKRRIIDISPAETAYQVPYLGKSLPIMIDFGEYIPKRPLTVTATIANTSLFSFEQDKSENITLSQTFAYFLVRASTSAAVGDTTTIQFALVGDDSISYNLSPDTVTLEITAALTSNNVISTTTFSSVRKGTEQELTVSTSKPALIYWAISLQRTFSRPCEYIEEKSFTFEPYRKEDPAQEQFGFLYTTDGTLTRTFTIKNLRSNKAYEFTFCTELQNRHVTGPYVKEFSTLDNNVRVLKTEFTFETALNEEQEINFACFLAQQFRVYESRYHLSSCVC